MAARRIAWTAALATLCLGLVVAAPFWLTTTLVRFALHRALPDARLELGAAELAAAGTLVLHDLRLNDSTSAEPLPLVTVTDVTVAFDWRALLARRVRSVVVDGLTVYARPIERSELAFLSALSGSSGSAAPSTPAPPVWIDSIEAHGAIRREPGASSEGWPLTIQASMLGDRASPSRRVHVEVGGPGPEVKTSKRPFAFLADVDVEPAGERTRVVVHRLTARDAAAAIQADVARSYAPKLPAGLQGRIDASVQAMDLSGVVDAGAGAGASTFRGKVAVKDLSIRSTSGSETPFAVENLSVVGELSAPVDRWTPAALELRGGRMQLAALRLGANAVKDFDVAWRVRDQTLIADRFAARIFDGKVSGSPSWSFTTNTLTECDLAIEGVDVHQALANLSPENLDADGRASGRLRLATGETGELSGRLDLTFDAPGTLKIGEIEEVKQMLVGNFGLDLANLAMQDLRQYPFREGSVHLESVGTNAELKIRFVRQPRKETDVITPRKETIDGREVWVGSLVVPTIDMTIPITGKSLAEILGMVSGLRPAIAAERRESEVPK